MQHSRAKCSGEGKTTASRARGDGTRRVYRSAWRGYEAWCRSLGREPLSGDPQLLAMYAARRAGQGVAVSTLRVDLAAIRTAYLLAGVPLDLHDPRLVLVVEGITRRRSTRPGKQAAPAVPDVLRLLLAACTSASTALGARDRAMLLLGFGAALRHSELVALHLGDAEPVPGRGLRLLVRRSKTDQHGGGQHVAVWANPAEPALCPAAALDAWLAHWTKARDLDGLASEAARQERPLFCAVTKACRPTGAALPDLMRQTRHKSTEVALGYLRPADLWRNNVTEGVFETKTGRSGWRSHRRASQR